ncbi:MAG: hypothetical protein ACTHJM_15090 [Marmoricola sp.]
MTTMSMRVVGEEIAELRAQIEELQRAGQAETPTPNRAMRRWRRPLGLAAIAALVVGMLAGVAGASGSTTSATIVPLAPAKKVTSNVTIAAHKSYSVVVIGGTTTVPSNATTVALSVTAKGAAGGVVDLFPTQDSAAQQETVAYPAGPGSATVATASNPGQSGEVTFYNNGTGSVLLNATLTGYSTQVTAGDISAADGSAGQVLTADGNGGAAWQPVAPSFGGGGQRTLDQLNSSSPTTIASVNVPAGTYAVNAAAMAYSGNGQSITAYCQLMSPEGAAVQVVYVTTTADASIANTGIITTTGGDILEQCYGYGFVGEAYAGYANITAVKVGSATGIVFFSKPSGRSSAVTRTPTIR